MAVTMLACWMGELVLALTSRYRGQGEGGRLEQFEGKRRGSHCTHRLFLLVILLTCLNEEQLGFVVQILIGAQNVLYIDDANGNAVTAIDGALEAMRQYAHYQ